VRRPSGPNPRGQPELQRSSPGPTANCVFLGCFPPKKTQLDEVQLTQTVQGGRGRPSKEAGLQKHAWAGAACMDPLRAPTSDECRQSNVSVGFTIDASINESEARAKHVHKGSSTTCVPGPSADEIWSGSPSSCALSSAPSAPSSSAPSTA
jgi:hypothetical protein